MEEKIVLYKFLEGIKDKFLFIFEEDSKEIDVIVALHNIQNKKLKIIFSDSLDYSELNQLLTQSNVLIIKNSQEDISIKLIDIPVFYYENTLKTFSVKDNSLNNLDLLINEAIKDDNKTKSFNIFDEKNVLKTLGLRIKKIRTKNNYTQEEFAESIGISTNFLSDVERGKKSLSIEKMLLLCKVLNVDLNSLFLNIELEENHGIVLGKNNDKKIILSNNDRKLHTLILGQVGCGKTRLMKKYIKEDINKNNHVIVIEPKDYLTSSLKTDLDKSSTVFFDGLSSNYYIDIFKHDIEFIMNLFTDAFSINSYVDRKVIKFFLNKTLESMKNINVDTSDYFLLILNQEISRYEKDFIDLKDFMDTITIFFKNNLVKTSFNADKHKKELDFNKLIKDKKNIVINTCYEHLGRLHKIYSNLILSCYINSVNKEKLDDDFYSLYIDEIEYYNDLIKKFILYARRLNIGITMTCQNINTTDNILSNTKNYILFNCHLNDKDNAYLSTIFNFDIKKNYNNCFYHIVKDLSVVENGYFEIKKGTV